MSDKLPKPGDKLLWMRDHAHYKAKWHWQQARKWGSSVNPDQREQHAVKAAYEQAWGDHWEAVRDELQAIIEVMRAGRKRKAKAT